MIDACAKIKDGTKAIKMSMLSLNFMFNFVLDRLVRTIASA